MRVCVVGCGAVGGYYGAKLAQAGHQVQFWARSDAAVLRSQGLRVLSRDGDIHVSKVDVVEQASQVVAPDLVVVACKTTANPTVAAQIAPLAASGATLQIIQNGLGEEAQYAASGWQRIIGCLSFICARRSAPAVIEHQDYGRITLARWQGDQAAGTDPALEQLAESWRQTGISAKALPDLLLARLQKLVWNVPYNGLSTVLNCGTEVLMGQVSLRAEVAALMHEVAAIAAACGRDIPGSFIERMLVDTERMVPYATSMLLDRRAGRPLEHRAMFAAPLALAQRFALNVPRLALITAQLQEIDRQLQSHN